MSAKALQALPADQTGDFETAVRRVLAHPESLAGVLAGLADARPKVRYGCLKILRRISETQPAILYPEYDRFVQLLGNENKILWWGALLILGNLAAVDTENRTEKILDQYLKPIPGPVMITAANCIRGAGQIAAAKPELASRIAQNLVRVEKAKYQTAECRNVALGHAVESLETFFATIPDPKPVLAFVTRQTKNSRTAVRRKAVRFLKRHSAP